MRNCGATKNVVYGYSWRCTALSHPKLQPKHLLKQAQT